MRVVLVIRKREVALDSVPGYRLYDGFMPQFTISRLAEQGKVNLQTIRYYEREGLLSPGARTDVSYRIYQPDAVLRIRFIKRAQQLGFTLTEIKELLLLSSDAHTSKVDICERAEAKLADVEQKLAHLKAIRKSLLRLTEDCSACGPLGKCPILENLNGKGF